MMLREFTLNPKPKTCSAATADNKLTCRVTFMQLMRRRGCANYTLSSPDPHD